MVGLLKHPRVKARELQYINAYGITVDIPTVTFSPCPSCTRDTFYRSSNKKCPVCGGLGKVKNFTHHNEKCYFKWIVEEGRFLPNESGEVSVGLLKSGDVILKARYETLPWFKDCIEKETRIIVDGIQVLVKTVASCVLKTVVKVHCTRTETD